MANTVVRKSSHLFSLDQLISRRVLKIDLSPIFFLLFYHLDLLLLYMDVKYYNINSNWQVLIDMVLLILKPLIKGAYKKIASLSCHRKFIKSKWNITIKWVSLFPVNGLAVDKGSAEIETLFFIQTDKRISNNEIKCIKPGHFITTTY